MQSNFRIMPSVPLQLGWISYWNLHPLKKEIERLAGGEVEFHKGTPSQVNRWLSEGKVSLAPSSSVCLVKNPTHEIAFPLGIAAYGPVQSVYVGLPNEEAGGLLEVIKGRQAQLKEIFRQGMARYDGDARKLASFVFKAAAALPPVDIDIPPALNVTPQSATSANLARILYRLWFGETAYDLRAAEGGSVQAAASISLRRPMDVLIGDEALQKRPNYRQVIDLAEAWRELTDLPFVFAVWQTTKKTMSPHWRQRILEAAEIAQARMRVEPCHYLSDRTPLDVNGRPIDLGSYWKGIQYRLGPSHFKGLAMFLAMSRSLCPVAMDDQAVVNIMRWQSFGAAAEPRM
jgi:predicted solute-binding protein